MIASTSRCTCSLESGLGFGAATVGGPFGIGFAGTVDGAQVVSQVLMSMLVKEEEVQKPILEVPLGSPKC